MLAMRPATPKIMNATIIIIAAVAAFFYLIAIIIFAIDVRNAPTLEDRDEELLHPGWDDENTHADKENDER